MPLSLLLPPLNLSSAREFVKFEVSCTGLRPGSLTVIPTTNFTSNATTSLTVAAERPAVTSHDSFESANSTASSASSSRRNRPSLSPEALLIHAFGPSALSRLSPPFSSGSSTSSSSSHSNPASSFSASAPSRASTRVCRRRSKEKFDRLPAPPPLGTFRSVAKPTKSCPFWKGQTGPEPAVFELDRLQMQTGASRVELQGSETDMPAPPSRESKPGREPLMSPEIWREKVEVRLQRRKLLRSKKHAEGMVKMPLDIDCRPLEGSLGLPPAEEDPKTRRRRLNKNKRNNSELALCDLVNRHGVNDAAGDENMKEGALESVPMDSEKMRKSMGEIKDTEELVRKAEMVCLKDSSG